MGHQFSTTCCTAVGNISQYSFVSNFVCVIDGTFVTHVFDVFSFLNVKIPKISISIIEFLVTRLKVIKISLSRFYRLRPCRHLTVAMSSICWRCSPYNDDEVQYILFRNQQYPIIFTALKNIQYPNANKQRIPNY